MSEARRHRGRRQKMREIERIERSYRDPASVRRDLLHRHAIMWDGVTPWFCRQSSGRQKPGYRSREIAEQVAASLLLFDPSTVLEPYRCRSGSRQVIPGEHWHLATMWGRKQKLTPTSDTGSVGDVRESTAPEEPP